MRFDEAIDAFLADKQAAGDFTSDSTVRSYRSRLEAHGQDVRNRDPSKTGREDVKRTLARWPHPNTRSHARAVLVSFYDWCMEEGHRETNPARQVRRPKKRPPSVYRLTRGEVVALLDTASTQRERRVIGLGVLAGLRNQELRGLQRRHFERAGAIWVSPDIAKGGRERYVPVLAELEGVVGEILRSVRAGEYVICGRRSVGGRAQTRYRETPAQPCSPQAVRWLVADVAKRAGITAHIHPHLLRHAFGDHIARYAGIRAAQATLGHASIDTTQGTYTGGMSLDEVSISLRGFTYHDAGAYRAPDPPKIPLKAPSGLEPEQTARRAGKSRRRTT